MTFSYVWEYLVCPESVDLFEATYGPEGEWVELFRRAPAYLGTELYRDLDRSHRYLTVDHWRSYEDCEAFRDRYRAEIENLDQRCEEWTIEERHVGDFAGPISLPTADADS